MWERLSRIILGPIMVLKETEDETCLILQSSDGEIISIYQGSYAEDDLIKYCLYVSSLDLANDTKPITFSQYANTNLF